MNRKITTAGTAPATASAPAAEDLGRDEMIALLDAAARVDGSRTMAAAMHLLTGTDLPGRPEFALHVDIKEGRLGDPGLSRVTCAWVRDWDVLLADRDAIWNEQQLTLITLAAGYATAGRPVDLHDTIRYAATRFGPQTAQRIIEATAITAGFDLATIEKRQRGASPATRRAG